MTQFIRRFSPFAPLMILLVLILAFFHKMAFTNLILGRGDTLLYFYPYWSAAAHALRNAQVPLWNPHLFMGAPLVANSQVGFFYPLNWPLWLSFSAPYAVSASILLHLAIAAGGTYAAGRRALRLSRPAALMAALVFALGGYLTAQVEHVNQLQGLAWLPWAVAICHPMSTSLGSFRWRPLARKSLGLSLVFALQLTAGHTQTVFITGVGLLLWLVAAVLRRQVGEGRADSSPGLRHALRPLFPLLAGAIFALLLAAVQLLPTLELVQYSSRQGGLPANEVLSFSLHPLLLGRALLPAYDQALFSEYVAFVPITALLLALVGVWRWRKRPSALLPLILAAGGLFLALGRFNPFTYLLFNLPGFDFFRAPARWLVLYALGVALLAGLGWEALSGARQRGGDEGGWVRRPLRIGVALTLLLVALSLIAVPLANVVPSGAEAPIVAPSWPTLGGWLIELAVATVLLAGRRPSFLDRWRFVLIGVLVSVILFLGSRTLPYNHLTAPAAYFEFRPPIARLRALASCDLLPDACRVGSPGRMLSLSDIFFDLGDQAELEAIYGDQLPPDAVYDYVVATKHKEVVSPNLPLTYGLASVDGFDGGILPLRAYSDLVRLVLPAGVESTDGRLREYLDAVPDARWLDLFNVRYLITDKVGDLWREGVFFDTQHAAVLNSGDVVPVGYVPAYEATEVWLLGEGEAGAVRVTRGRRSRVLSPERLGDGLWRVVFSEPFAPDGIYLEGPSGGSWTVRGLALVDERDDTFHTLAPGQYRLIYSGDVKIYENLDVLPRAFAVPRWTWRPDVASSVEAMGEGAFRPWEEAVVVGEGEPGAHEPRPAQVEVVKYEPEEVVVRAHLEGESLLILADAYYPGWQATMNGERRPVQQVDGLFRGIMAPAGDHEIVFTFESRSFLAGRAISLGALLLLVLFVVVEGRNRLLER